MPAREEDGARRFSRVAISAMMSRVPTSRPSAVRGLSRLGVLLFTTVSASFGQQAAPAGSSLLPGPQPADAPAAWKEMVGIYGKGEATGILLESGGKLVWRTEDGKEFAVKAGADGSYSVAAGGEKPEVLAPEKNASGAVEAIRLGTKRLERMDAGSDPAHFYHVKPTKPVAVLREEALKKSPPAEAGAFRTPDLVELVTLDTGFHLEIGYATPNNFLSTPVYTQARAFMQKPAAEALQRSLKKLEPLGYGLLIHDAYRPWYVTEIFWEATPPAGHAFVADPQKGSKHNRGCAVDITLYDLKSGKVIEMPGLYDEMSPRSFPTFPGGTSLQRWHRELLRKAIEEEGFTVDGNEWWHFDYKDWKQYPILNVPFENLGSLVAPRSATH